MKRNLLLALAMFCMLFCYASPFDVFSEGQISVVRMNLRMSDNAPQQSSYCTSLQHATPELSVWNGFSTSQKASFLFKMYAPSGKLLSGMISPKGYTSKVNANLQPGMNTVSLPSLSNCAASDFTEGEYKFEVWYNNDKVYFGNINVTKQPEIVQNEPAVVEQPKVAVTQKQEEVKPVETPKIAVTVPDPQPEAVAATVEPTSTPKPAAGYKEETPRQKEAMKFHVGITGGMVLPSMNVTANGPMSSVIDYGMTDISGLTMKEAPDYVMNFGYGAGVFVQIPLIDNQNLFLELGGQFAHFGYKNDFANKDDVGVTEDGLYYVMDYANKETYSMNYVNVPVLIGYEFGITPLFHVDVKTGPVVGVLASAKLNCEGYVNSTVYELDYYEYVGYANSVTSGSANLLTGTYDFKQHFTTGSESTYDIKGTTAVSPFKAINASWRIGAGIGVGPVSIDVNYDLGLMNVANAQYWENREGGRIPGLLFFGETLHSRAPILDYVQKFSNLSVGLSVRF